MHEPTTPVSALPAKSILPTLCLLCLLGVPASADTARDVLMIVGDPAALPGAEAQMRDRLVSSGYTVTLSDDGAAHPLDLTAYEVVFIADSTSSSLIAGKYKAAQKPVIVAEENLLDDLGMTGASSNVDYGVATGQTQASVVNPNHFIAGGLAGTQAVQTAASTFSWGRPGIEASVVAYLGGSTTQATLFTYEKGNKLADLSVAAGKRALIWMDSTAFATTTDTGKALFDRTFDWALRPTGVALAGAVSSPIVVDGNREAAWDGRLIQESSKLVVGSVSGRTDLWANSGVTWDASNVYVMVEVTDDVLRNDSSNVYDDDGLDIYFDMNNDGGETFNADDFMYQLGYGDTAVIETKHNATSGVVFRTVAIPGGYRLEAAFPWTTLGKSPVSGMTFGLDVIVNDDDDGGQRDAQRTWNAWDINAYQYPNRFGDCALQGEGEPPPPPPPTGPGATVPWVTYEAEDYATSDLVFSGNNARAAEASGGKSVLLDAPGEYVRFTSSQAANRLVLRYSVLSGARGTVSLWINNTGTRVDVSAHRLYEEKSGKTLRNYDEVDVPVTIQPGDTVEVRKTASDGFTSLWVDLIDLELAPAPGDMPEGFISVIDPPCRAEPNDGLDDTDAIQDCIDEAVTQRKNVWFPPGSYNQNDRPVIRPGVHVKGAGIWHTRLYGSMPNDSDLGNSRSGFELSSNATLSDMRLTSPITTREQTRPAIGLEAEVEGAAVTNYTVERVWIEYCNTGMWMVGGYQGRIRENRVRLTYADGIHIDREERGTVIENNHVRGTGDDGIAVMSVSTPRDNGRIPLPSRDIIVRNNTVVANYWGRGISMLGGTNILYEYNLVQDSACRAGILVELDTYETHGVNGVTIRKNTVLRSGGMSYFDGSSHSGIFTNIDRDGLTATGILITENEVREIKRYGIGIDGDKNQTTTVTFNRIVAPEASAIWNSGVGTIIIRDNIIVPP